MSKSLVSASIAPWVVSLVLASAGGSLAWASMAPMDPVLQVLSVENARLQAQVNELNAKLEAKEAELARQAQVLSAQHMEVVVCKLPKGAKKNAELPLQLTLSLSDARLENPRSSGLIAIRFLNPHVKIRNTMTWLADVQRDEQGEVRMSHFAGEGFSVSFKEKDLKLSPFKDAKPFAASLRSPNSEEETSYLCSAAFRFPFPAPEGGF